MKKAITLSIYKFIDLFPTEEKATKFIEKQIWGEKPICPFCSSKENTQRPKRKGYHCRERRKDFTVRIGNIFENSRLPLKKWLFAMYLTVTSRKGVSSLQLSKELDITQKTAWFLLQRIRETCGNENKLLKGVVEIDEVYIGGLEKNKHNSNRTANNQGRSTKTKIAVVGLKQRDGNVIAKSFRKINSQEIQEYVDKNISLGSVLSTDEAKFYRPIKNYDKVVVNHSAKEYVNGVAIQTV